MFIFGTAGKPLSSVDIYKGSYFLEKIGLNLMELEFVRGVYPIKRNQLNKNLVYSVHAPYYINLNAKDEKKLINSKNHIIKSANEMKNVCVDLVFHPGYYLGEDKQKVFKNILNSLLEIRENIDKNIILRPETTGKVSQFGDYREIIELCTQIDNCLPCLDFAHIYARSLGKINDYNSFSKILDYYEKYFDLKNMHIHLSGISYNRAGEYKHLPILNSNFNFFDILKVLVDYNCNGKIICESPLLEFDALILKTTYNLLRDE